jgi:RHS repeat-associated protein
MYSGGRWARVGRFSRVTSVVLAAIMLTSGGTAVAMPAAAGNGWSLTSRQHDPSIPVNPAAAHVPPLVPPKAAAVTKPVWPAASDSDVVLADGAQDGKQPRGEGVQVRAANAPVRVAHSSATADQAAAPASKVHVHVADQKAADALGLNGVVLSVTGAAATGSVHVGLDYGSFAGAIGGGWADRLRLFELPACALTTPDKPECRKQTPVADAANDDKAQQVTADVGFTAVGAQARTAQQTHVLAATAASSGSSGTPTSLPLSPAGSWSSGGSSGDFSYNYPIPAAKDPSGSTPNLALSYSSSSVDGLTSATNNQSSWVGDGWDFTPGGYVERHYKSCGEDLGGNNGQTKTGDECWGVDNATLVLGGKSTELIKVTDTLWRPKNDDGSKVELLSGATNGSSHGQYWKVTTGDGTQYFLGLNRPPGWTSDKPETQSAWTVPVFGNNAGEDCYQPNNFAASWCQQAWRWNLDYVVDPHGNASTFYYQPETNNYGLNLNITTAGTPYTAGGYPLRVEYGLRLVNGSIYGSGPTDRVTFDTAERCLPTVTPAFSCDPALLTAANAGHWPDVPFDQICAAGKACPYGSPAFFSRKRLTAVHSQYFSGSTPVDADVWNLVQTFPGSGDASPSALWLSSITHTGGTGTAAITLPPTTFGNFLFPNRVDTLSDKYTPLTRNRMQEIRTETGGRITVAYSAPDCVAGTRIPASPQTDTLRCYAAYWNPPSANDPVLDWFHKYVATDVTEEDLTTSSLPVKTHYDYLGDGAWHYDESQFTPDKEKTWDQWRGYGTVRTTIGAPTGTQTTSEVLYLRGMDGDHLPTGTRSVSVSDLDGGTIVDQDPLAGFTRETRTYLPNTTTVDSASISDPWLRGPTATSSDGILKAYMMDTDAVRGRTLLSDGKTYRRTQVNKQFNSDDQETQQEDLGDVADPSDDTCTNTTYLPNSAGMFDRSDEVSMFSGTCAGAASAANSVTDVKVSYDQQGFGIAPTKGDITEQDTLDSWDGSGKHFVPTTTAVYDDYGREVQSTDVYGNVTTTGFIPATGGPVTGTTQTNPMGWTSTTTLDPVRGLPTSAVDVNGVHTDITYDALGRKTAVWNPGRNKAAGDSATAKFAYVESQTAPLSVETFSLQDTGAYTPSFAIYDGLGRARQTQVPAEGGGRIITDSLYDSRGLQYKSNAAYYNADSGPAGTLVSAADNTVMNQTVTQYDTRARPTATILMSKGVEQWRTTTIYDGDRTTTIPPAGASPSTVVTDEEGQTVQLLQYTNGYTPGGANPADVTSYKYNAAGAATSMTDSSGNVWTTTYDLRGRKIQQTDPDTGTMLYGYDEGDQLKSTTDARGKTIAYTYDSLGRKTQENADAPTGTKLASWAYDTLPHGLGLPVSSTRWDGTNAYVNRVTAYDVFSRPTATAVDIPAKEGPLAGTYAFSTRYTATGAVAQTNSPQAGNVPVEHVVHTYTDLGLPDTTYSIDGSGNITNLVSKSAYTTLNEMSLLQLDGATSTANVGITQTYDQVTRRPQTTQVTRAAQVGSQLANRTYSYDPAGNVTKIANTPDSAPSDVQCFNYDYLQRMSDAWTPSTGDCSAAKSATTLGGPAPYWSSYTFDKTGNRKTQVQHQSSGDVTSTYNYPDSGPSSVQPHALQKIDVSGPAGTSTSSYGYDAAGSTTTRDVGGNSQTFSYDQEGHTATESDTSGTSSYVYDADGNRLITHDPTGATLAIGDLELFQQAGTTGVTAIRHYTHGSAAIAERAGSAGIRWMLGDLQGTNDLSITQGTLQPTERYTDPFGNARGTAAPSTWPDKHGFVGGYQDTTGLTHLGARDYDPTAGRFISADPVLDSGSPQQWNGYAYGNNAPATSSDPTGLWTCIGGDNPHCSASGVQNVCIGCVDGAFNVDDVDYQVPGPNGNHWESNPPATRHRAAAQYAASHGVNRTELTKAHEVVKKSKWEVFIEAAGEVVKSLIGWDDIQDCLNGGAGGCIKTIINLIPWGKILKAGEIVADFWKGARALETFGADVERAEKIIADGDKVMADAEKAGDEAEQLATSGEEASSEAGQAADDAKASGSDAPAPCNSFLPGTRVLLADGTSKPIELIKTGDVVVATDPATGKSEPKHVVGTIVGNGVKNLVALMIKTSAGQIDTIVATDTHPFWVPDLHAWVTASNLVAGSLLQTSAGTWVQVVAVRQWTAVKRVFNLTVDYLHTYYVVAGTTPVLVHNCPAGGRPKGLRPDPNAEGPHVTFRRDASTGKVAHYAEWAEQTNPRNPAPWVQVKRVDMQGMSHYDKVTGDSIPTPHVNLPGGNARPTESWENTAGY